MSKLPAAARTEREREQRYAAQINTAQPSEITVEQWLGGYRALFPDTRLPATAWAAAQSLRPFRKAHARCTVYSITALQAQAWATRHPHHAALSLLRHAWKRAAQFGVAPANVWDCVQIAPRPPSQVRPPTDAELAAILGDCRARSILTGGPGDAWRVGDKWDPYASPATVRRFQRRRAAWDGFADLIEVAAYTGARQAGLLRLEHADVDLPAARMTVTEKGSKTRTVVLPPRALSALERQMERLRPRDRLGERVWLLTKADLHQRWVKVRGGFPFGFHSLRHYAATWMLERGASASDVAQQLGHVDRLGRPYEILVARCYGHPDPEAALRRIEETVA